MSNQDSFITEVSEEVRKDKLYALMRRYGWIAIALVVLVVGGASVFEWQKAKARAAAEATGDAGKVAVAEYRTAIRIQPDVTGPRSNLAALYENLARAVPPDSSQAKNAAAEVKRLRAEELQLLARDAKLASESAIIQYRYGLALYLAGQLDKAEAALQRACDLEPQSEQFQTALRLLREKMAE